MMCLCECDRQTDGQTSPTTTIGIFFRKKINTKNITSCLTIQLNCGRSILTISPILLQLHFSIALPNFTELHKYATFQHVSACNHSDVILCFFLCKICNNLKSVNITRFAVNLFSHKLKDCNNNYNQSFINL